MSSEKRKNRELDIWPRFCLATCACFLLFFTLTIPLYAQGSGYYDTPMHGRPPSAFSLCCCKKDNLSSGTVRAFYTCEYVEDVKCPESTRSYNVSGFECPSSLMFTKFVGEET